MTLSNLAIVLSPNLMFSNKDKDSDKYIKEQTEMVDILFKNANSIGLVSDEIMEKVNSIEGEPQSMSTSSADELDLAAHTKQRGHRRRSRSISGITSTFSPIIYIFYPLNLKGKYSHIYVDV